MGGKINERQIAMLIIRLVKLGLRGEAEQYDWLLEAGVNVLDLREITQREFHHEVIPALVQAEAEAEVNA